MKMPNYFTEKHFDRLRVLIHAIDTLKVKGDGELLVINPILSENIAELNDLIQRRNRFIQKFKIKTNSVVIYNKLPYIVQHIWLEITNKTNECNIRIRLLGLSGEELSVFIEDVKKIKGV